MAVLPLTGPAVEVRPRQRLAGAKANARGPCVKENADPSTRTAANRDGRRRDAVRAQEVAWIGWGLFERSVGQ